MATDKTATLRKLLQKAEKAGTEAEARTYREKATELMQTYSIDEAELSAKGESTDTLGTLRLVIDGAYAKPRRSLLNGIAKAFGCRPILLNTGVVVVYGWQSDLDMIDVLFASLQLQAMREAKMSHARNRHVNGRTWTTSFVVGFGFTVADRLTAQRASAVADTADATGTALAIYDRSQAVDRAFRAEHPRTTTGRGSRVTGAGAFYSGLAAGKRADLGNGLGNRRPALAR